MRHLFYVHSNICIIAVYDTVAKILQETNDEVVILQNRASKWEYFLEDVRVVECSSFGEGKPFNLRKQNAFSIFKGLWDYKNYLRSLKKNIDAFIDDEDFDIYLPTYNNEIPDMFVSNPHCKGYYLIEEGSMDYLPLDFIKKISCKTKQAIFKKVVYPFIGTRFFFILHQGSKFRGCLCLYEEAFPFISMKDGAKVVNGTEQYIKGQKDKYYPKDIIVTGYLFEDVSMIKKCFHYLLKEIGQEKNVAIKIHPEVFKYYPEKIALVQNIMKECGREFVLLDPTFSVEAAIIKNKSNIYSLFTRSSLLLYGLKNQALACAVIFNGKTFEKEYYSTVDEFVNIFVTQYNYK